MLHQASILQAHSELKVIFQQQAWDDLLRGENEGGSNKHGASPKKVEWSEKLLTVYKLGTCY